MAATPFDREQAFDDDYLYFCEATLNPEQTAADVELIWRLLRLEPGLDVLDLACGHGRIANSSVGRAFRSRAQLAHLVRLLRRRRQSPRTRRGKPRAEARGMLAVDVPNRDNLVRRFDERGVVERDAQRRMIVVARK